MGAAEHRSTLPAELRAVDQWIVVLLVPLPNGKTDKIPVDYRTAATHVDAHDPAHWTTYQHAATLAHQWGPQFTVGFVLTENDPFFCVDIDGALQPDGTWSPLSANICAMLPNCVIEVSQSGRGLHVWGQGHVPPHSMKRVDLGVEFYTERRFIAIGHSQVGDMSQPCPTIAQFAQQFFPPRETHAVHGDGPDPAWRGPTDDAELLRRAMQSRSAAGAFGGRATFADLWTRNVTVLAAAYPPDRSSTDPYDGSSADAALAQHLAFWTGKDAERIDRLMRQSGLVREKYDRDDYMARTIANACSMQRDVYREREMLPAPAAASASVPTAPVNTTLTFAGAHKGWIDARLEKVYDTLQSPESGVTIRMDRFMERPVIGRSGKAERPLTDVDITRIRTEFQRRGFKPIAAEIAKSAVLMAADDNAFDSAHDYVDGLVWDGVQRIDTALPTYYRTADTPYTRAVGAYLFTALAGRSLQPGVQADMVPVLVGLQGERKSSAVQALCPLPEFFAEVNLKKIDDDNTARLIRGKLVGEIAELRGLFGQDRESIKAWITRRVENWVPKFIEFATIYPRRIVFIGTTNEREFLDDSSGERRWLPVVAGKVDVEAIERDREQLWAEGAARFKASGIAWQEAECLARGEHAGFKLRDPWCEPIESWLAEPHGPGGRPRGAVPFKRADVALGALHRLDTSLTPAEQKRLSKALGLLGYESTTARGPDGRVARVWTRAVP